MIEGTLLAATSPNNTPLISVVIPVKNGTDTLETCLQGILSQSLHASTEIILIDSGSQDGTVELASKYPVTIHRIPSDEFNHGTTRNLGVALARGEFVVMTVQDAVPKDPYWLERMLRHFEDDRVAGVCGLQAVPHEVNKNPVQWTRLVSEPKAQLVCFTQSEDFLSLSPKIQRSYCRWDDVNAMYRRSAVVKVPFRRVTFAEDAVWARDALVFGYALVYDPCAQVYHYHQETFTSQFKRTYTVRYHSYIHFRDFPPTKLFIKSVAQSFYRLAKERRLNMIQRTEWFFYNVQQIVAMWAAGRLFEVVLLIGRDHAIENIHSLLCAVSPQSPKSVMPDTVGQN